MFVSLEPRLGQFEWPATTKITRDRLDQHQCTANGTVLTKKGQHHHHGKEMEKQARYTEDILLLHHRHWGQGKPLQILVCSCSHTPRTKFYCERGTVRLTAITTMHCNNSQMGSSLCTHPQATVMEMKTGLRWLALRALWPVFTTEHKT